MCVFRDNFPIIFHDLRPMAPVSTAPAASLHLVVARNIHRVESARASPSETSPPVESPRGDFTSQGVETSVKGHFV